MNQRKIGALLSYVDIIITTIISLIYTPFMLRILGQSEYGITSTASSFVSYLSVLSFGIGGSYLRFNAIARASGNTEEEKQINGMYLSIFSILALLVLFGGIILEFLTGILVKNTFSSQELFKLRVIIFVLIANMMLTFICNVFVMALQSYEEFIFIRIVMIAGAVIQPLINTIALKNGGRAISLSVLTLLVNLVMYITLFLRAKTAINFSVSFKGFKKDIIRDIFCFSGFLFLNTVTDQITFSTDGIILSATRGASSVAVYNIGATFKNYFMQMSTSISSVFAPKINQIVANHEESDTLDDIFIRVGRIQFYIIALILIGYCSIGKQFIQIWAGQEYTNSFYVGLLLMLAITVPLFQNVGIEIQKAKNKHKARSIVYFLIALFNVLLTIPFCHRWGGIGAAFATTICMFMGTVVFMNYYYSKHIGLNIKQFWTNIISIFPGLIAPTLIGLLINRIMVFRSYLGILGSAIIICLVYLISIWLFSFNEYEKNLIRSIYYRLKGKY